MIHKISLVLAHSKGSKSRINIKIIGNVENKHKVYETFKIIPLSLIQNAIKYRKCSDVDIVFDENGEKLLFSVVSIGDFISEEEIGLLFNRGYRTVNAKRMNVEGNGLGLYALKVVADAHDFDVRVTSTLQKNSHLKLAKNIFTVSIF